MAVTLVTHLLLSTQLPLVSAQRWEVVSGSKRATVANASGIISKGVCDSPSIAFALVGGGCVYAFTFHEKSLILSCTFSENK